MSVQKHFTYTAIFIPEERNKTISIISNDMNSAFKNMTSQLNTSLTQYHKGIYTNTTGILKIPPGVKNILYKNVVAIIGFCGSISSCLPPTWFTYIYLSRRKYATSFEETRVRIWKHEGTNTFYSL